LLAHNFLKGGFIMKYHSAILKPEWFVFLMLIFNLLFASELLAQPSGGGWSKNVSLQAKGIPGRSGGSSNVWGWMDSQTGKDYVLVI